MSDVKRILVMIVSWMVAITGLHAWLNVQWATFFNEYLPEGQRKPVHLRVGRLLGEPAAGQILADMSVLCLDDCLLLDTEPGWGEPLAASLEHHLVMERVKIHLTTQTVYFLYEEGKWRAVYDSASPPELPACDEAIYEALRIEAGIPRGRVDFDEKTLAPETGQAGRAIHYKKGCYIGQEIVARIDARGHTNRSLVKLTTEQVVEPGTRLMVDGKDVGWITSAALGPTKGIPVALGYLRNEHAAPGTQVTIGAFGNGVVA